MSKSFFVDKINCLNINQSQHDRFHILHVYLYLDGHGFRPVCYSTDNHAVQNIAVTLYSVVVLNEPNVL